MPDNKKHHYVPKFYLRNFATRLDLPSKKRVQIHQLDVNNLTWRYNIGLKDQCQSPYLYGKGPELENLLKDFEGEFASVFRTVISDGAKSLREPYIELYIRYFAILSLLRTPRQQRYLDDSLNNLVSQIVDNNYPEYKDQLRIQYDGFFHLAIGHLSHFAISLDGMRPILVHSRDAQFVTSDNPVIRHNQILRAYNKTHPCLGFLAKGLQIFIPLSPQYMIILFDEDAYKAKGEFFECSQEDIRLLNGLQVLNCDSSVYFRPKKLLNTLI
ncbi:DUF4238 domain-containing protein [Deinococcus sp. HMF7604]|uniref:DUF4238 domain-containing protein n=1 Tax=Deinococcus betulae TaxID=2873312 RepID=UPI001CCC15E5|nr:DUF4238 domain-containing protein [Deinococcus betulae]MBZ9751705.1 DUF4238 domain-containing protein [Deinococcus betulae]